MKPPSIRYEMMPSIQVSRLLATIERTTKEIKREIRTDDEGRALLGPYRRRISDYRSLIDGWQFLRESLTKKELASLTRAPTSRKPKRYASAVTLWVTWHLSSISTETTNQRQPSRYSPQRSPTPFIIVPKPPQMETIAPYVCVSGETGNLNAPTAMPTSTTAMLAP